MGCFEFIFCQLAPPSNESLPAGTGGGALGVLLDAGTVLVVFLAPFVGFALVVHWLELVTQRRLAERFGWKSILWTGWLGTPIHELSHVFMCRVFQHRIDEVALFEPDQETGRLGYVKHSFRAGNWYQELGNLFIGVAPLLGGSIVLAILLWMFFPGAASQAIEVANNDALAGTVTQLSTVVSTLIKNVVTVANLATVRFWLFIYLVLCVGSHMAPSASDYQGASRGVYVFGGFLFAASVVWVLLGANVQTTVSAMIGVMGPLFAIFGLTVVLCSLSAALVYVVTSLLPR